MVLLLFSSSSLSRKEKNKKKEDETAATKMLFIPINSLTERKGQIYCDRPWSRICFCFDEDDEQEEAMN